MPGVSLTRWTSRAEPRADRRQKGVIARVRCAIRGGSQARTTAPDLRSGLAGVHGFKSLARAARSGKSHPPHSMRATRPPLRKTFIRGYPLAAREEGTMSRKTKTMLFAALGLVVVASALVAPIVGAMSSIGPRPEKAVTITLYGSYTSPGGWGRGPNNITEPGPTLTVDQGDVVTFQLFANDSMAHQLIIDVDNSHSNNSGAGWSYPFSSKTTAATFTYTANTAGTFAYFCNIHGYNVQRGTFVVNAAPAPAGDNTLLIAGGVIVVVVVIGVAAAAMRMRKKKPGPPGP